MSETTKQTAIKIFNRRAKLNPFIRRGKYHFTNDAFDRQVAAFIDGKFYRFFDIEDLGAFEGIPEFFTKGQIIDKEQVATKKLLDNQQKIRRRITIYQMKWWDRKGVDLSSLDFCKIDLSNSKLAMANMSRAILSGARFSKADLNNVNFKEAKIVHAQLDDANLNGASFQQANVTFSNLNKANLRSANLVKATFKQANLEEADLTDANLTKANLFKANLKNANLERANLSGANLNKASLDGVNLKETVYNNATNWPIGFDINNTSAINIDTDGDKEQ